MKQIIHFIYILTTLTSPVFGQNVNPCNANTFWAVCNDTIYEYELGIDTVIPTGNILAEVHTNSLAIGYNLNNQGPGTTFYATNGTTQPKFYNGQDWVNAAPLLQTGSLANPGAYKNYCYYYYYRSGKASVLRYTGSAFDTVYQFPQGKDALGDLVVDTLGNAIVFTHVLANPFAPSDSILIVSPQGGVIKKYPFVFDLYNNYGAFYLNNTVYLGLGAANTTNPNTLIPITLTETTATAGNAIAMPDSLFKDLAACNGGLFTGIAELNKSVSLEIYPNPATYNITINWEYTTNKIGNLFVFDTSGKQILSADKISPRYILSTQNMANGLYFIQVVFEENVSNKKLIVQH